MIKIYKKLTKDQKKRGVVFSSCLSCHRIEGLKDTVNTRTEILNTNVNKNKIIKGLKDDNYLDASYYFWKFNIIRT